MPPSGRTVSAHCRDEPRAPSRASVHVGTGSAVYLLRLKLLLLSYPIRHVRAHGLVHSKAKSAPDRPVGVRGAAPARPRRGPRSSGVGSAASAAAASTVNIGEPDLGTIVRLALLHPTGRRQCSSAPYSVSGATCGVRRAIGPSQKRWSKSYSKSAIRTHQCGRWCRALRHRNLSLPVC